MNLANKQNGGCILSFYLQNIYFFLLLRLLNVSNFCKYIEFLIYEYNFKNSMNIYVY